MKTCKELINFLSDETCWFTLNIFDDSLTEMSRYGRLPDSQLEIHIEGSEGYIPHIHIQIKNGNKSSGICHIKLLTNEYLRDSDDPGKTLNSKERKKLDDYMKAYLPGTKITNWEVILGKWNEMNPSHIQAVNKNNMPNYTIINEDPKWKK